MFGLGPIAMASQWAERNFDRAKAWEEYRHTSDALAYQDRLAAIEEKRARADEAYTKKFHAACAQCPTKKEDIQAVSKLAKTVDYWEEEERKLKALGVDGYHQQKERERQERAARRAATKAKSEFKAKAKDRSRQVAVPATPGHQQGALGKEFSKRAPPEVERKGEARAVY